MKTNSVKEGRRNPADTGAEPAVINGDPAYDGSKSEWQQAKLDLKGEAETKRKDRMLEAAPESERWDPFPGSRGRKATTASSEDEDEEGRSANQRLVEEGMEVAEQVQMRLAAEMGEE